MNPNQTIAGNIGDTPRQQPTLRERIALQLADAQDRVTQLSKLEHTIPARWLDMTNDQIWEKYGFHVAF